MSKYCALEEENGGEDREDSVQIIEQTEQDGSPDRQEPRPGIGNANRNPTHVRRTGSLSGADLNPPEIQKVVVEHILRKEDISSHSLSPLRLRTFSGKCPELSNETDYETWRSQID